MEHYDVVILGTGLSECVLSAVLSQSGYSVLQLDSSDRYGTSFQNYNYVDLCTRYNKPGHSALVPLSSKFSIDYTPKLLLAGGLTQRVLIKYDLSTLVNFLLVPGCYVYKHRLYEVPTSETKSLQTGLVSFLQKPRLVRFFYNVRKYFRNVPIKLLGTMREQYKHYGVDEHSAQVIGHAIALNLDDNYLDERPSVTFEKIRLYIESLRENGDEISPFVYPLYGMSEVCQAFVRKASVAGAVYRLRTSVEEIRSCGEFSICMGESDGEDTRGRTNQDNEGVSAGATNDVKTATTGDSTKSGHNDQKLRGDQNIKADGANKGGETSSHDGEQEDKSRLNPQGGGNEGGKGAHYNFTVKIRPENENTLEVRCKALISDISYTPNKRPTNTKIIRATLIVDGVVPLLKHVPSAQILFLSSGLHRKTDVFALILGHRECVAPKGYKVVLISYVKEGDDDKTLDKIIHLFGKVVDRFVREEEVMVNESVGRGWYVVSDCDESMHVENGMHEVVKVLERMKKDGFKIECSF